MRGPRIRGTTEKSSGPVLRRAGLLAILAATACAAPSSFDGLTGGADEAPVVTTKEDATITAPRPVSPISVSFVSSARPRLHWDLGADRGSMLTGAIVEMARTRDFTGDVKRYVAPGSELAVPEDLELGVWFWRLKGSAGSSYGTNTSPTWEMVVRGPAAHGSSDTGTRSMVDLNGDGEPDLLVGGTGGDLSDDGDTAPPRSAGGGSGVPSRARNAPPPPSTAGNGKMSGPMFLYYQGDHDRGFAGSPADGEQVDFEAAPFEGPMALGGGTDFNGDGLTDVIESGVDSWIDGGKRYYSINLLYASGKTGMTDPAIDWNGVMPVFTGGPITTPPSVREAADVDGDGYGDSVVGLPDIALMVIGTVPTNQAVPALLPIYPLNDSLPTTTTSRVAMGGFDANGDGLADVVFSLADSYEPAARAFAAAGSRTTARIADVRPLDAPDARLATAFAAGDFNGDGIDDIAITTPVGETTSRVCIWYGNRDKLVVQGPCVAAPAGEKEFGAGLTAADLEGDGVDELLATSKSSDGTDGVRVVHVDAHGTPSLTAIAAPGLGVRLTTIWPGRPGKARWAAVAADGSRIGVFEGTELRTNMLPPSYVIRGFGRGLR